MILIRLTGVYSWQRPRAHGKRHFNPHQKNLEKWRAEATLEAAAQNLRCDAEHEWRVSIDILQKDRRKRDADRVASLVLDALEGIVYADDSQVTMLGVNMIKRPEPKKGPGSIEVSCFSLAPQTR